MKSKYPFRISANIDAETHRFFKLLGYGERQKFLREAIREKRGIKSEISDLKTYRCEATLQWPDNCQCEYAARVEIGGHKYCHLHASLIATKSVEMPPADSARCECTVENRSYWSRSQKALREAEGWRCNLKPNVKVNGVNCCYHHAKLMILQHMIKDGKATALPYNGPYKPLCNLNK